MQSSVCAAYLSGRVFSSSSCCDSCLLSRQDSGTRPMDGEVVNTSAVSLCLSVSLSVHPLLSCWPGSLSHPPSISWSFPLQRAGLIFAARRLPTLTVTSILIHCLISGFFPLTPSYHAAHLYIHFFLITSLIQYFSTIIIPTRCSLIHTGLHLWPPPSLSAPGFPLSGVYIYMKPLVFITRPLLHPVLVIQRCCLYRTMCWCCTERPADCASVVQGQLVVFQLVSLSQSLTEPLTPQTLSPNDPVIIWPGSRDHSLVSRCGFFFSQLSITFLSNEHSFLLV